MKKGHFTKINCFIKKDPKLEALLKLNVPDIDPDIRRSQIAKLSKIFKGRERIGEDEENTFN